MAMEAISSARNDYKVNFLGKKEKSAPVSQPVSGTMKAVPLAVLLAMSPLTTTNAENIMREENVNSIELAQVPQENPPKNFVEAKGFGGEWFDYTIAVVKDEKNSGKYKIWMDCYSPILATSKGISGYMSKFNKVNYNIYDDTGRRVDNFSYNQAFMYALEGSDTNFDGVIVKDACSYIEELMKKYDTGVKPQVKNYALRMTPSGALVHGRSEALLNKEIPTAQTLNYGKIYNVGEVSTSTGNYMVYMHSTDGDNGNFECVSISNEDGTIRHKVTGLVACNAEITSIGDKIKDVGLHQINLIDPQGKSAVICNQELWETLLKLTQTTDYNKAFSLIDCRREHTYTTEDGKISPSEKPAKL